MDQCGPIRPRSDDVTGQQFFVLLPGDVITLSLKEKGLPETEIAGAAGKWKAINGIIKKTGAVLEMVACAWIKQGTRRRPGDSTFENEPR